MAQEQTAVVVMEEVVEKKTPLWQSILVVAGILTLLAMGVHAVWMGDAEWTVEDSIDNYLANVITAINKEIKVAKEEDRWSDVAKLHDIIPLRTIDGDAMLKVFWETTFWGSFKRHINFFCWDITAMSNHPKELRPLMEAREKAKAKSKAFWKKDAERQARAVDKRAKTIFSDMLIWDALLKT